MAFAKKCDICGALYEEYNIANNGNKPNGFMFVNAHSHVPGNYYTHSIFDCCPQCMDDIKRRIKELQRRTK